MAEIDMTDIIEEHLAITTFLYAFQGLSTEMTMVVRENDLPTRPELQEEVDNEKEPEW